MDASKFLKTCGSLGAALLLGGYSGGGGGAPAGPPVVPYACEDGRQAAAVYESGGDHRHAKVLLTFDGHTTELEAAPTLYGRRYLNEPNAAEPRHLMWSLRGEHAALAETNAPEDVTDPGRPIASCMRLREGAATADAGHATEAH